MPKTRIQKQEDVKIISEKLSRSKSVVFTDYQGLTMKQLSELRQKLSDEGASFNVTKNTLLERALKEVNLPIPQEITSGPTATLFSFKDAISPIKILVKTLKDAQIGPATTLRIKAGLLDAQILDSLTIARLAALPSKKELQAKVVGSLSSPLYGIVGVLQANLRNLVFAVDQIRIQRG